MDLKKFSNKPLSQLKTDKEKWFYLLKNASTIKEKEVNTLKKEPVFQRALERLERLSSDPTTRKAYEASINEHRDHLAVLSSERKEGQRQGILGVAKKMLKRRRPIEEIAEDTGLSTEDIRALEREIEQENSGLESS